MYFTESAALPAELPVDLSLLPKTFEPKGKVHDAGGGTLPLSPVVIQALKPASLILRGADGSVYFARQLSKGDAVRIGNALKLSIIAGPCQLESRQHALETAHALKEIGERLNVGIIYKTSFDKANRTSANAARGLGLEGSLPIFAEIRESDFAASGSIRSSAASGRDKDSVTCSR